MAALGAEVAGQAAAAADGRDLGPGPGQQVPVGLPAEHGVLVTVRLGHRNRQALQAAMKAVRTGSLPDGSPLPGWKPIWAHPAAWAPFTLVSAG